MGVCNTTKRKNNEIKETVSSTPTKIINKIDKI